MIAAYARHKEAISRWQRFDELFVDRASNFGRAPNLISDFPISNTVLVCPDGKIPGGLKFGLLCRKNMVFVSIKDQV